MPNHGYCKNCWWYLPIKFDEYGKCYMNNGDNDSFKEVKENGYCPDYSNRKRYNIINKSTLEEWILTIDK